jgi:hypothetical protein
MVVTKKLRGSGNGASGPPPAIFRSRRTGYATAAIFPLHFLANALH